MQLKETYIAILNISNKYLSGKPHIHISSIASELALHRHIVLENVIALSNLKLVEFTDNNKEFIILSDFAEIAKADHVEKPIQDVANNAA